MKQYFTQNWTNRTCQELSKGEGKPLESTAGSLFRKSHIQKNDCVYVVTVRKGILYLIGRLTVGRLSSRINDWDHIIAADATPKHFEFKVPTNITKKLSFVTKSGLRKLVFMKSGSLDGQTLGRLRKLSPASARLLDKLLPAGSTLAANDVPDGLAAKIKLTVHRFIRDTKTAREIKSLYKFRCQVCGKRLEIQPGVFYAEAHHLKPLGGEHKGLDVRENLLCLCPNHHALFDYFAISLNPAKLRLNNKHELRQSFVDYHNAHFRQHR